VTRRDASRLTRLLTVALVVGAWSSVGPTGAPLEGFGSVSVGGAGGRAIAVTSLSDSGPGTLRQALHDGGSGFRIVFAVAGTIHLKSELKIREQPFVTIDGGTAPAPGIALEGHGLYILRSHDVIVKHLRVRNAAGDGIMVKRSQRIVVDHCSVSDSGDENVSVTEASRDITIGWSVIAHTRATSSDDAPKGMLVANFDEAPVTNVSIHHNVFINESQRSPQVSTAGLFDIRANVILNWRAYGVRIRRGAWGNVVRNVFRSKTSPERALIISPDAGRVYVAGNRGPENLDVNGQGTAREPFGVAPVATEEIGIVERVVLRGAGAAPRDGVDETLLNPWRWP